jgi:2-dehydro-3-deoxyphosphogluconate aldolase/(4S)-4-hydroxy-2-oxoglutarate aldolase
MTTGTVTLANAAQYIEAGACAVGIGGELVGKEALANGNFDAITENARQFVEAVKKARV